MKEKYSLKKIIMSVFIWIAILSSVVLGVFSFINIADSLRASTRRNANNTLVQVDNNVNILLQSYEDALYQVYTSDDVISYIDDINSDNDVSVAKSKLRRYLRALVNSKDYIRSITIITENKEIIAYDQMTQKTYENGWLKQYSMDADTLYDVIGANALLKVFPPEYGTSFAYEDYYLLHLAHRFVDYRDIRRNPGVVILSIDERMIQSCYQKSEADGEFIFITDDAGRIISCGKHQDYIGKNLERIVKEDATGENIYAKFLSQELEMSNFDIMEYHDDVLGWNIICAKDRAGLVTALNTQLILIIVVEGLVFLTIAVITVRLSDRLSNSVEKVVRGMQSAKISGSRSKVEIDDAMPLEIETIALGFNEMIERLEKANASEKKALVKQKEAQIAALEAQINPHFLYNTLDTINWMAIDRDEYEISNAIGALASILRYAISDSSAVVSVDDEVGWLKQYIYLQQVRLKNKFTCDMEVAPEAKNLPIHKLLLQPFVENAIVHGFEPEQELCELDIRIWLKESLHIMIADNGKGMPPDIVDKCNRGELEEEGGRKHIGMANAITRLRMYYGESATVHVESEPGEGSTVTILVPIQI
ncbi:MAG: histidine kinase [Lachnospiraceae bacterium]|nr:histidine kinase [Lachnospiraceae bacterium]